IVSVADIARVVLAGCTSILNCPSPVFSTLVRKSQLDDATLSALIGNFQSFVVFTVIVLGLAVSPFCQKRNVGSISSGTGITALIVSTVVAGRGSSVETLIVFSCIPVRSPILSLAVISPFSPGGTSSCWV